MHETEIRQLFENAGAVITDSHIVYTSGEHGSAYVNKDAIYPRTRDVKKLCREIALRVARKEDEGTDSFGVDVVVAPAIGGVILSQWIADMLTDMTGREILSVYAEKQGDDAFVIRRGYDALVKGKRVLVAEDILNTGGSVQKAIEAVRVAEGDLMAVAALCNRGGVTAESIGAPDAKLFFSLLNFTLERWKADQCPLCRDGVPINVSVGHGQKFLDSKK